MKTSALKITFIIALAVATTSCNLSYQVFTVQPTAATKVSDSLVFSNADVEIGYSFWANGGAMDYYIHNKTNKPIYVNWDRSHFVLNGYSRDYFGKNQNFAYNNLTEVVKTKKAAASKPAKKDSVVAMVSTSDTTAALAPKAAEPVKAVKPAKKGKLVFTGSVQQSNQLNGGRAKQVVEIPPNARVISTDFDMVSDVQNDKKLKLGLHRKRSLTYSEGASPYTFRNYVTYSFSNNFTGAKVIDNGFYVSEITSLTRSKFLGQRVKAKRITSELNKKQFLYDLPYYNKGAFFVRNPAYFKLQK